MSAYGHVTMSAQGHVTTSVQGHVIMLAQGHVTMSAYGHVTLFAQGHVTMSAKGLWLVDRVSVTYHPAPKDDLSSTFLIFFRFIFSSHAIFNALPPSLSFLSHRPSLRIPRTLKAIPFSF